MTGDPKVIAALEAAYPLEAHMHLQYRKDRGNVKFKGLKKLRSKLGEFGDDTHDWMNKVQERILFLGGDDAYQIPPLTSPNTLTAVFQNELALEMAAIQSYEALIAIATGVDATTVHKFQHYQMYHEQHAEWLERQLNLMLAVGGEEEYIQEKI